MAKAFIFDVDGTIAETEELHRKAYNSIFSDEGISWNWSKKLYKELLKVTGGKERLKHYKENFNSKNYHLDINDISRIHSKKNELYNKWVDQGLIQLRPGIKSLIYNALKSKIQLAISTSTSQMNVEALFIKCFETKPNSIFKVIATGDMVKRKKPDPELYLLALNQLSLRPEECIAFEDSYNGLVSAKRAKLKTICSPSEYHIDDDFEKADFICKEFTKNKLPSELRQLIYN